VRKLNKIYGLRREMIVDTLTRDFADHLDVIPSAAGLHLVALARGMSVERVHAIVGQAFDAGVAAYDHAAFTTAQRLFARGAARDPRSADA